MVVYWGLNFILDILHKLKNSKTRRICGPWEIKNLISTPMRMKTWRLSQPSFRYCFQIKRKGLAYLIVWVWDFKMNKSLTTRRPYPSTHSPIYFFIVRFLQICRGFLVMTNKTILSTTVKSQENTNLMSSSLTMASKFAESLQGITLSSSGMLVNQCKL